MKEATQKEKQLVNNKKYPDQSNEQTANASCEKINDTKKSCKRGRIIWEDSQSRSHEPTG